MCRACGITHGGSSTPASTGHVDLSGVARSAVQRAQVGALCAASDTGSPAHVEGAMQSACILIVIAD